MPLMSTYTLVLGGTGKTGRRIVERLERQGVPVRAGSRALPFDWAPLSVRGCPDELRSAWTGGGRQEHGHLPRPGRMETRTLGQEGLAQVST